MTFNLYTSYAENLHSPPTVLKTSITCIIYLSFSNSCLILILITNVHLTDKTFESHM